MKPHEMKWKAFTASILFHVILAAAFVFSLPASEELTNAVEVSLMLPVENSHRLEAPSTNLSKPAARVFGRTAKSRNGFKKSVTLFPGLDLSRAHQTAGDGNKQKTGSSADQYSFKDSRRYDTDISEIFGESGNENWAHFKEVYTKVDSNLNFDSILAQYNHFGRVYVQFELDENGILKTENLKVAARDSILKVHVLRAIKKSFSEPQSLLNSAKGDKGILYQARFDFNFGNYQQNFLKQNEFGRPVFSFRRFTEEKPVPEELLEQLLTGGVSPNISSMYERWQKYNQKKRRKAVEFDPFSSYRSDPFYFM